MRNLSELCFTENLIRCFPQLARANNQQEFDVEVSWLRCDKCSRIAVGQNASEGMLAMGFGCRGKGLRGEECVSCILELSMRGEALDLWHYED